MIEPSKHELETKKQIQYWIDAYRDIKKVFSFFIQRVQGVPSCITPTKYCGIHLILKKGAFLFSWDLSVLPRYVDG